ncbi:imidazole glycerol phosphate synthase subunit HisF [soil metagenome]
MPCTFTAPMLTKRIIPCLDVKDGRTVKGVNFVDLQDAGDPVEQAYLYAQQGADELVFLDITATSDRRKTTLDMVQQVAKQVNIPFTVGGGIRTVDDVYKLLHAGADKISVNSAAVRHPELITELAKAFGTQCIVVAIDAKVLDGNWKVHLNGGRLPTNMDLFDWAKEVESRGGGEILFTSMDHDGTKHGFAVAATAHITDMVNIPVIASGGAGAKPHFADVFKNGYADAALAASIFHFGHISIPELKAYLKDQNIAIR